MKRLAVFCCLFLAACSAGSGEGLDASGRPIGETPDAGDEPTLANIQARVFTPVCTQCHVGAAAPQGLRLDSANAFDDLVDVPSREVGGLDRVEPFDPDRSYLVQKIEGTASEGGRMPLGGPPLPDEDIQLVRQWISDGALPGATASSKSVSRVRSVQMSIDQDVQHIQLGFTAELDPSSILPSSVQLFRISSDQSNDAGASPVYDYSIAPSKSAYAFQLFLAPDALAGDYRLAIGPSSATAIIDVAGRAVQPYSMEFQVASE